MSALASTGAAERLPPITALVRRHAEDAGFYWQQIDSAPQATALSGAGVLHFADLLQIHLEGLQVAGAASLAPALESLSRWRKPGEAFAAMHAALTSGDLAAPGEVMALVARDASGLLRGAIGALAAAPEAQARAWVQAQWLHDAQPDSLEAAPLAVTCQVAALRACALLGWPVPPEALAGSLAHTSPFVRAAAVRGLREPGRLLALLQDPDSAVRAEAAISLGTALTGGNPDDAQRLQAASTLWLCVALQAEVCQTATGWYRLQTQRRLSRWLRHLAHLAPIGHPDIARLLAELPLRQALSFVLHHGDSACLPFVLAALDDTEQARWAGFVWSSLTGIDLAAQGLVQPNPPINLDQPLTRLQQDADQGLPLPDAAAVRAYPSAQSLTAGQPLLLGQPRSAAHLAHLLRISTNAPQLIRAVAVGAWNAQQLSPRIRLRAAAAELLAQDAALARLIGEPQVA